MASITTWPNYHKWPVEQVSRKAFDSLPDYSCSVPTGQRIGKVWKCRYDYYDESKGWFIREYIDIGSKSDIGINSRHLEILEP